MELFLANETIKEIVDGFSLQPNWIEYVVDNVLYFIPRDKIYKIRLEPMKSKEIYT